MTTSLLEQLLMDEAPSQDRSSRTWRAKPAKISACRCCSARPRSAWGVRRLLKALRHEAPGPEAAARRLGRRPARRSMSSRSTTADRSAGLRSARVLGGDDRRRVRAQDRRRRGRAARRLVPRAGREDPQDRRGARRRRRRGRQGRRCRGRRMARHGQAAAGDRGRISGAQLRASRSSPPTARTTSACRARCSGCSRRIAR